MDFIENQSIKKEDFYKKTSLAPSNFKGEGLKSELGGENIAKILKAYSEINARWLLTGEGNMLDAEILLTQHNTEQKSNDQAFEELRKENEALMRKYVSCLEEKDTLRKYYTDINLNIPTIKEPETK